MRIATPSSEVWYCPQARRIEAWNRLFWCLSNPVSRTIEGMFDGNRELQDLRRWLKPSTMMDPRLMYPSIAASRALLGEVVQSLENYQSFPIEGLQASSPAHQTLLQQWLSSAIDSTRELQNQLRSLVNRAGLIERDTNENGRMV